MAAASPSPLASSVEKTNGAKLSRLLIDGGTTVLRKIFDRYHPPENLLANLKANSHTLNHLLRRRVLHKPQWDLLFPPGGATPDSNTFDITLLFLLLTNICALSPPPSGWNTKPLPSDNSVEANLARIKFFRNELYGHVTTTGIDTPTFSALWQEISAVLVAFGLPQVEIDQLKAEHCGEEDFIDVLFEWADSEEDIKSQLKDIRQYQSRVQQAVDEVHLTQLEDRKILQVSNRKLEEVHEVRTKTQKTVDEVRQNQLEDRGTMQECNKKLQEVFQIDRKTHQAVTNIRETQIDDSKVIQKISQSQTNTEKGVAKLLDRHEEFHQTLQETKSRIEDTHGNLLRTQGEHFEAMRNDLKQTAEDLEGEREKRRENELLKKLAKIDTLKIVRYHSHRYVEGTRLSIFAKVERWFNDRSSSNRVMVISGNAGMGKSVISAVMCEKKQEAGRLAGSHFCQHDRARHRKPKVMLQSLASQLCDFLPHYKKALVEKLSRNLGVEINNMEVKELFEVLFEEPLTSLNDPGLTYLMVIDGLDESEFQGRNELLDVIANYFQGLPLWIRFLVTTRPEMNIAENLKDLHPLQLDPNVQENVKDIQLCFEKQISHLLQFERRGNILQALVQKSEGVMLYAHYLIDFITKEVSFVTPEQLDSILPSGISSVYHSYFKRLETELCSKVKVTKDQFLNFLHALTAAREPLPLGFVSKLLLPINSTQVTQEEVNAAIACVSALLPVQGECIHFFHKSVKDWLIEESHYRHAYFIKKGHEGLSKLCIDELSQVKLKGVDCAKFRDTTKYALRHGVQHMLQLDDVRVCSLEEVVTKFVLDVELVYAKLCVNVTAAFEDIVCVQKQAGIEELQRALNTMLVLLRKHVRTLEKLPHSIFQTLLNEGGRELSSEALHLLETKYSEIPYMEYLDKENLQGRVQSRFPCSDCVICFDVSPQLDYMVCECYNGLIQLWSLNTGKQLWKRNVEVPKYYFEYEEEGLVIPLQEPYRGTKNHWVQKEYNEDGMPCPSKSLFRSVVFHPTKDLVLPGILSHAYTFDGNLKPLFDSSKCCFWVCSISVEKTKMLTDCPNDAKSIIMWSLKDGSEMNRFTWSDDIASFAWSCDERLLAISDLSGSLTVVDVMDGYRTLAQTTILQICGMIKFSPDCRCLHSLVLNCATCHLFLVDVNMENDDTFSLDVLRSEESYYPCEFESCSEPGFLLGDPFYLSSEGGIISPSKLSLAFVLNEKSVLTVRYGESVIEMLQLDELTKDTARRSKTTAREVVLSLSGDTLYVITTTKGSPAILMAWDITSSMFKPGKKVIEHTGGLNKYNLVAVREGVLLQTSHKALELWNVELSECIRSWADLEYITEVIPISEERVACEMQRGCKRESEVIILDTAREGSVSTIAFDGDFVGCNSKCHVISVVHGELQMKCGDKVLWKISQPFGYSIFPTCKAFSPTEQYYVFFEGAILVDTICVLDVDSGKILRPLQLRTPDLSPFGPLDCKFVSDEECITYFFNRSSGDFFHLFNVKSGDLLSEIATKSTLYSLAACPRERLLAIGFMDSKVNFEVLQVKLPGDKRSRGRKRSGFINKEQSYNTMS
ncbi:uncharacterized protein [Acropora muricata]|uniref:uncharacterized protein isoform X1 n=1 Tax=Acropora muricata TaxID=159855 RepID=UPI0034E4B6D8